MADHALALDLVVGVEESTIHRVRRFGYGDGYEIVAPDGINSRIREYNITTTPLSGSDFANLREDLDKVCQGDFFTATLSPYSVVESRYRVVDSNYTISYLPSSERYVLSFTLREAFAGDI